MAGLIGAGIPRLEDGPLLVGKGRYIDDIALSGVWHAAFVRSPHPHAAIRGIDAQAALALPGVHAVLTLDDLAPVMLQRRMLRHSNSGTPLDRIWSFALAAGETSYVGDGGMTIWASTQKAHDLFQSLTALLGFDESLLRVATPDVGGGFGPKLCVYPEDIAVVAAAKLKQRSIKWIEDRREHFTNAAQERDQYWSLDIAVDAEGKLLGIRGRLIHDV